MMPFFQSHQGSRIPRPLVLVFMGIGVGALLTMFTFALMRSGVSAEIDAGSSREIVFGPGSKQYKHDIVLPRMTHEVRSGAAVLNDMCGKVCKLKRCQGMSSEAVAIKLHAHACCSSVVNRTSQCAAS